MRDLAVGRAPAKHAGNKAQRESDQDSYHRAPEAVSDGKYVAFTASLAPPQTDDEAEKAPDECAHERNGDPGTDHSARRLCAERGENVVALRGFALGLKRDDGRAVPLRVDARDDPYVAVALQHVPDLGDLLADTVLGAPGWKANQNDGGGHGASLSARPGAMLRVRVTAEGGAATVALIVVPYAGTG